VHGVLPGNSSNVTIEVRPEQPAGAVAGATYQLTAMVAHVMAQPQVAVPFMVARANLTTAPSHLGPQLPGPARPLITEREHNAAIWAALPKNRKAPSLIRVAQGYHGSDDVGAWLSASRALVGFGAAALTAAPSAALNQIFDSAGVTAARITGGLRPPLNATSHASLEVCKDATSDNGVCARGRARADVPACP